MAQQTYHLPIVGEEHLTRILSASHCLLWEAMVTATPSGFSWNLTVLLPETIRRWLPLASPEGKSFAEVFAEARDPEDIASCNATSSYALRTGAPSYAQSYRVICAGGHRVWLQESVSITPLSPGQWHLTGVCTDITALKAMEEALDRVLTSAHCIIWHAEIKRCPVPTDDPIAWEEAHAQGTLASGFFFDWKIQLFAEETVRAWLSVANEPSQNYSDALYRAIEPEDRLASSRTSTHALLSGKSGYTQEVRLRTQGGDLRWLQEDVHLKQLGHSHWYAVGINLDITERKTSELGLAYQARHDQLTGLANRRYLLEALEQLRNHTTALLFVDIDNFKLINDNFGHLVGDQVLVAVTEHMRAAVAGRGFLARLGGDEFTILLPYASDEQEALIIAQRLTEILSKPLVLPECTLALSASIGVAFGMTDQPKDLLRNANTAMHHAKSRGKANYCIFNPQMDIEVRERFALENALRNAIQAGEIVPHYQPILELATHEVVAIEALARWQTVDGVSLSPARFIPIAEETGLILPLGAALLRRACQDMAQWRKKFPHRPLHINVNVSERQFHDPEFVSLVTAILEETQLPPTALTLELTESILLQDTAGCLSKLQELDALGIRLALDDFGTGYSSLSYLSRLPVHALKIDRSFVSALSSTDLKVRAQGEEIVRAIIALAQALSLAVTAEGIEHQGQCQRLSALGAHYGQGYLFAQPLTATAMSQYLQKCETLALPRVA